MESLPSYIVMTKPFAVNGDKNDIPLTNDGLDGYASQLAGYPPICSVPVKNGGKVVRRADLNGVLYMVSNYPYYIQCGGMPTFNQDVSDAINGYPINSILWSIDSDSNAVCVMSLIQNNTYNFVTNPEYIDGQHWKACTPLNGNVVHTSGNETISGVKTFSGSIVATTITMKNNANTSGSITKNAIEFMPNTTDTNGGYIDFHYAGSTSDYTSRLIETSSGNIGYYGLGWNLEDGTTTSQTLATKGWANDTSKSTNIVHRSGTENISGIKTHTETIKLKSSNINQTTAPSSTQYGKGLEMVDANGTGTGIVSSYQLSDGKIATRLQASRTVNGSVLYSGNLEIISDALGNFTTSCIVPTEDTTSSTQIDTVGARNTKIIELLSSIRIGEIISVACSSSYIPAGCLPCDGYEYSKAQFAELWANYLTSSPAKLLTCTYSEYTSSISTYGQCGKFAVDTTNETFKVPTIKDGSYLSQALSDSELGKSYNESLPNINGEIGFGHCSVYNASGAFSNVNTGSAQVVGSTSGTNHTITFNASSSSSTYQNGAKVQGDNIRMRYFVVVANGQLNQAQIDWSQWATSLSSRMDTSLTNATSTAKYNSNSWIMPNLNAGFTFTNGYTTTTNCIAFVSSTYNAYQSQLWVDGKLMHYYKSGEYGKYVSSVFPVHKGGVLTYSGSFNNLILYPCIGG